MKRSALPLLAAILAAPASHAQFGGMVNPAMLMNPMTMGMMSPTMMAPMGGFGGMSPAQYMANPYLNPTSSLMPFLSTPSGFGNPYLMPAQPPQQQSGFFSFMPVQPAPAAPAYGAPQSGFFPMMPSAAPAYGYGMPAYMPAQAPAPAATPDMSAFMSFFPAMTAPQAAPSAAAPQAAPQPAAAPATNMFDAAAWAQMFPNSIPPNMQAQPAAPASAAAQAAQPAPATAQPVPAGAPNYYDPNMWMQWMVPAAPK